MVRIFNAPYIIVLFSLTLLLLTSCGSRKDVVYFQDAGNFESIVDKSEFVSRFKVDDLVSIHISSLNPEASAPFNLLRVAGESMRAEPVDYLVDQAGEIDFPVLGKLRIQGLSPDELRILLRKELSDYLKDPIINIRLVNFTVTVLGEVRSPGTYPINGEQVTILEALGYAGDLTIRGVRQNVLVVRDFNGTKVYTRIDLTSKNMMKSAVYYLTQNDVVYVEPNKSGISSSSLDNRANLIVAIVSTLVTTTVILLTRQ